MSRQNFEELPDYYKILGVGQDADAETIRKAYKKLALQWHPDRNRGKEAAAKEEFQKISDAYGVLSDEDKRLAYNADRRDAARARQGNFGSPDQTRYNSASPQNSYFWQNSRDGNYRPNDRANYRDFFSAAFEEMLREAQRAAREQAARMRAENDARRAQQDRAARMAQQAEAEKIARLEKELSEQNRIKREKFERERREKLEKYAAERAEQDRARENFMQDRINAIRADIAKQEELRKKQEERQRDLENVRKVFAEKLSASEAAQTASQATKAASSHKKVAVVEPKKETPKKPQEIYQPSLLEKAKSFIKKIFFSFENYDVTAEEKTAKPTTPNTKQKTKTSTQKLENSILEALEEASSAGFANYKNIDAAKFVAAILVSKDGKIEENALVKLFDCDKIKLPIYKKAAEAFRDNFESSQGAPLLAVNRDELNQALSNLLKKEKVQKPEIVAKRLFSDALTAASKNQSPQVRAF